ncbi:ApbE family lipoprotein [Ktedonobacter racemifer DSM 44963]|uniref:FAD:protein FMN transferase n=2 Tax=Ktedonobacter racemifer TaxID=363277 RepID=D6U0C3_KTERA|nr:ApbE family lipoprotein [Ktedonobacter racemifer DSM 44963]
MGRREFKAMGTTISLLLPIEQAEAGEQLVRALFNVWESTLSRFLPESELSQLNRQPGVPTIVSELLLNTLETALTAAHATEGIYDPTLLEQLIHLGYDRTFEAIAPRQDKPEIGGIPGGYWRAIQVDRAARRVTLPLGCKLDFGGIAKGMAVDAALHLLQREGISCALVNAGGDLAVLGLPPGEGQWPIAIPGREESWTIPLRAGALATSGIARRHWQKGQTRYHHLLDPHTGLPAWNDLWSVTVAADRCEQAEIAAKVAFILGFEQGAAFLRAHRIAGLFVREDGTWEAIEPWPIALMKSEEQ